MRRAAKRFARADQGNIAMIFAITLVPLLALVGAAVDYTRASAAHSAMQSALDTAALMISRDVAATPSLSADDIQARATKYFNALYHNADAAGVTVSATYSAGGNGVPASIAVEGNGSVPTDFMKLVGINQVAVGANSRTTWGNNRMRVAMALDVTGSMDDDGKLEAMIQAANGLVDTLRAGSKTSEDAYMSVIPFNVMINVGAVDSSNIPAWLDFDTTYGSCSKSQYTTKSSCAASGKTWTPKNLKSWKGCVTDRGKVSAPNIYDTTDDVPDPKNSDTLYLAQSYSACPSSLIPMTSVLDKTNGDPIKDKIKNLTANGNTNQAIGMQMAWMTLQPTAPFPTPPKDSSYKYTDVIILLSDGMNTQDRWYTKTSQIDARQTTLCANINAQNTSANPDVIRIYTIQVNTGGDPESKVLKGCATKPQYFFPTSTANGIASAFTQIGSDLTQLRIAQ
jgi:Flp pilus assembly protein TadG